MASPNPPAIHSQLEQPLLEVEGCLSQLADALVKRDSVAIESSAVQLQRALSRAVGQFSDAARNGGVPPALRHRLVLAGGRVAAQRESLARATASLDRAIDVLMPSANIGLYSPYGRADRKSVLGKSIQA